MKSALCSNVQEWLTAFDNGDSSPTPPVELCDHIAACASCRAFLLLLTTKLLQVPLHIQSIPCTQCQHDLAAYADVVRYEGQEPAIRDYAHVWWHLWVCADCAETYHVLTILQGAESIPERAPILLPRQKFIQTAQTAHAPRPFIRAFTLPQLWFSRMLMPLLTTSWGSYDTDAVIHDEDHEEHRINVVMRRYHNQWTMIITVDPPLLGDIVLTIGKETFRQTIRPDGTATIDSLPSELLLDPTSPGIALILEPAE